MSLAHQLHPAPKEAVSPLPLSSLSYKKFGLSEVDSQEAQQLLLRHKEKQNLKIAMIAPAYNEGEKIIRVFEDCPRGLVDTMIVADDGSTDSSIATLKQKNCVVVSHPHRRGVGAAIRSGIQHAQKTGHDIVVIIAGNGKDTPQEVHRVLYPLVVEGFRYVQGSRYLEGGAFSNMPIHRRIITSIWPYFVFLMTGRLLTEGTNGYRAYPLALIDETEMNLEQAWLDDCIEHYIMAKALRSGLPVAEVPVSKHYPATKKYGSYTKVRLSYLHHRLKPYVYLALGIRS